MIDYKTTKKELKRILKNSLKFYKLERDNHNVKRIEALLDNLKYDKAK